VLAAPPDEYKVIAAKVPYWNFIFFLNITTVIDNIIIKKGINYLLSDTVSDTPHHDWNRPAGRPRTTWMSQIVWDTGLTAAGAWTLAEDRSTWRALRPTAVTRSSE